MGVRRTNRNRTSRSKPPSLSTFIPAALYLRRSTNAELQAESLETQEDILRRYAESSRFFVTRVYQESASGRDASGREQFLQLIDDVTRGGAEYEVVLVRDVSRWGRFDNIDESAYYDFLCLRHGVEVVYVEESFARDSGPYAALQKSMKRVMAADFSREKSRIVTHGKRRTAEQGFRAGAPPPFGMKRILVNPDGSFVQDLPPKAHKLLSCYKTKLAPANNRGTEVVKAIFNMFVAERMKVSEIAKRLNETEEARPAGGARWYSPTVLMILTNEGYAGVACLWTRGEGEELERLIRVEGAYDPIISAELFAGAKTRLDLIYRAPTTHARLVHDSRRSFELWGHLPADLLGQLAGQPRSTFGETRERQEVLAETFAIEITEERRLIRELLGRHFRANDRGALIVIDDVFTIAFNVGWVRSDLVRRPVEFSFTGDEASAHLLICIGVAATPVFARELLCCADPTALGTEPFRVLRGRDTRGSSGLLRTMSSDESLVRHVRHALYAREDIAGEIFLRVVQNSPRVVFRDIENELRWPRKAVRRTYYALRAAGAALPEAGVSGRVAITCPNCGQTRLLTPSDARLRKTGICGKCAGTPNKLRAVCGLCGAERFLWPSAVKNLREGLSTPCHRCALAKGRSIITARNSELQTTRKEKYEFLHHIGLLAFRLMNARTTEYLNPRLWSASRRRLATLQWRDARNRLAQTLTIDCSFEFVERCRMQSPDTQGRASLADAILDRSHWTTGGKDARGNFRWMVQLL